jgi:DNA polymerase-3 subunit beta
MECIIKKEELLRALSIVQSVVEKKTTLPILSFALVSIGDEILEIKATNLDVGIKTKVPCKTVTKGEVAVLGKKLYECSKEIPDSDIYIKLIDGSRVEIRGGRSRFKILSADPRDFPEFPSMEGDFLFEISSEGLLKLIDKTFFAASIEESRYFLNGIFVEKGERDKDIRFVATDGHRLAFYDHPSEKIDKEKMKNGIIISRKGILEIKNLVSEREDNVVFMTSENNIVAKNKDDTIYIRMIEGEFPKYKDVIPKEFTRNVYVDKNEFLSSIKRISLVGSSGLGRAIPLRMFISADRILLSAENPEVGEVDEEIDARLEGQEIEIGFNGKYLADALSAFDTDDVIMSITSESGPALIKSITGDDTTCVIMPMKL